MIRTRPLWTALLTCFAVSLATPSDAAPDKDPAARGLDVFVHAPHQGAPRGVLPVQVEAFGFPEVTSLVPLAGVTVEALWDPEHLGPNVSAAPPPVRVTTDAAGKAHLDVPIPDGDDRALSLLIGVRSGEHQRTRAIEVQRVRPNEMALYVTEREVVPGGATTAWVRVTSTRTEEPVASVPVEVTLNDGGVARSTFRLTTDQAGTAMVRVPIPTINESSWSFDLRARVVAKGEGSNTAMVELVPREETPGTPRMVADFSADAVRAGDRVKWRVIVRDATDQPIVGLPVRTWIGPKGTEAPRDAKAWEKASTLAITNPSGELEGEATAPSTVVQGVGTTLTLVARTRVEGSDLEQKSTVAVGYPASSAELRPEAGAIVPGVEQRMLLRVLDGHLRPVSASFSVEGDGLKARVVTDAFGEADIAWRPPVDLGAFRNVGPCAGGVAAAVIVRSTEAVPALADRREPFELCVSVNRDASAIVRADAPLARAGDRVHVRVDSVKGQPKGPWSVILGTDTMGLASSIWIEDGEKGGDIELPKGASGIWSLSAVSPSSSRAARSVGGAILVAPPVLPKLTAKVAGGRAAPRGVIEIEAEMSDGRGGALAGTVAAVVVDLHGGGSVDALTSLDTRRSLCQRADADLERCDKLVEGDPAMTPLLRSLLSQAGRAEALPDFDPGGRARQELIKTFGEVLKSLEGAVFEAAQSPDQLRDVRRKGPSGWVFNPELMTLVTAAMDPAPQTPGGEPLALADLFAVDKQVTFDNVARRITRLKLFRILSDVRAFRRERMLDPDEPALRDPNAILRKLVRDQRIPQDLLLDPWGGTIQFTKVAGPPIPFLTISRGFELRAPGPDRQIGTGDDVRDPFERVLQSASPYAEAVSEDRIVDAKVEMEVGDATISAWESMFNELTGTSLGSGGLGLSGIGEGGGGRGEGIGLGSIGTIGHGSGRGTMGVPTGVAFWSRPQRTDANGKVKISVPLGDIETTWRIALVGVPDRARPATATLDVPVALPLSARVESGATWVEGDDMDVTISIRNRSAAPARATIKVEAGGVAELAYAKTMSPTRDVPAGGSAIVRARVKAPRAGAASLRVTTTAPGVAGDVVNHTWDVLAAGAPMTLASARWVEAGEELKLSFDDRAYRVNGPPRIVLERGWEPTITAALESLDPDKLGSPEALADSIEAASRVERWALARLGQGTPLAARASEIARRAVGRMATLQKERASAGSFSESGRAIVSWSSNRRAIAFAPAALISVLGDPPECPPSPPTTLEGAIAGLESEPPPTSGVVSACWDAFVTSASGLVTNSSDSVALARAVLALADRPHRSVMAASLVDRLRERVNLLPSGAIALSSAGLDRRDARALVFAALLRAARLGTSKAANEERLAAWIRVQRDPQGGYGSSVATRSVVHALLSSLPEVAAKTTVTVTADGVRREVVVGPSAQVIVPLDASVKAASVEVHGAPVLARFEQPMLRLWSHPPEAASSVLHLETEWPSSALAGAPAPLRVILRHELRRSIIAEVRIPLPPGVSLAARVSGVRQMQGVLAIRAPLNSSALPTVMEIPLRFALSGRLTAPEARARIALEESAMAIAPARPFKVR